MCSCCRFVNLILNKTASRLPNGTIDVDNLDYSKLTLDEYTGLFAVVNQADYCPYTLSTAFLVFNGFAFSFAVATLFLVAIVPVFIRRQHWDSFLARCGAVSMSLTIVFFVVAFLLAGFITAGVGQQSPLDCDYVSSENTLLKAVLDGNIPNTQGNVLSASAYATLAMVCLLVIIVTVLSLKETTYGEHMADASHVPHMAVHASPV